MTAQETEQATLAERVTTLERTVAELQDELATATDRDLPLLKGTVRALALDDIETLEGLPDAGRAVGARLEQYDDRLGAVEHQLETLGELGDGPSSKQEKVAAILSFAANKGGDTGKVALSPHEIKGCTGVSRRYAYELIDVMATDVDGVRVRDEQQVQTGSGSKRKGKALLVDCELVHDDLGAMNRFTTDDDGNEGGR